MTRPRFCAGGGSFRWGRGLVR